jgi:hypothetical protein
MLARVLAVVVACALGACEPPADPAPKPATSSIPVGPATTVNDVKATTATPRPTPSTGAGDKLVSLAGNSRNAIAWAPLSDPDEITVEGSVPRSRAWSTSKPLVIAAYLDTVVGGDPTAIPAEELGWIREALRESDNDAISAIRDEIVGSPGEAMTRILRSIGDTTTTAPDSYVGTMHWSVTEQVRFMSALGNGQVVSPATSAFLLREMQPVPAQQWGLGSIGARAFKPGWVNAETETRQMGIVGNYAVAIITAGDGPATLQGDGDYAHEWQLNRLAHLLAERIGA